MRLHTSLPHRPAFKDHPSVPTAPTNGTMAPPLSTNTTATLPPPPHLPAQHPQHSHSPPPPPIVDHSSKSSPPSTTIAPSLLKPHPLLAAQTCVTQPVLHLGLVHAIQDPGVQMPPLCYAGVNAEALVGAMTKQELRFQQVCVSVGVGGGGVQVEGCI